MPKAYIIARRAISYRRYITRSARNGYHCKKPLLSGRQKRFFTWRRRRDLKLLRNPSCGARKNPSGASALFLGFFDRCAHPYSLHRLRRARRRCPRRIRRSGSNPVFPHKKPKAAALLDDCFLSWRRRRDLNPRAGYPTYSLSRGAPSPLGYFCMVKLILCRICRLYYRVIDP